MKLHCPHCGVKGSAEDSYIGRKVKCPKCQGVFEVLSVVASEPPADTPFSATLSPLPAEMLSSVPEVEIPVAAEDDLAETEPKTMTVADASLVGEEAEALFERSEEVTEPEPVITPAAEQEETLDWEDIASEIDLQLAEATMGEEQEGSLQDGPAAPSSFEGEFEKPIDDSDRMEEFPSLDADDVRVSVENRKETVDPDQEQVPSETLNRERPGDGGKGLSNDPAGGYDNEKPMGNSIYQVWAKARDALARWFGK